MLHLATHLFKMFSLISLQKGYRKYNFLCYVMAQKYLRWCTEPQKKSTLFPLWLTPLLPLRASRESPPIQEKKKSTIWQLWDSALITTVQLEKTTPNEWFGKTKPTKSKASPSPSPSPRQLCTSLQLNVQPSAGQAAVLQRQHPLQVSLAGWFLSATQSHHVSDLHLQPHTGVLPRRVSSSQRDPLTKHYTSILTCIPL